METREKRTIMIRVLDDLRAILSDELPLLEGVQRIAAAGTKLRTQGSVPASFLFLMGIASETDDLPIGQDRQNWNAKALAKKDVEAARYLMGVRLDILRECRNMREWLEQELGALEGDPVEE